MKRSKSKNLGAISDDPERIMERAVREFRRADDQLDRRQAAEKAHLALSTAVEKAVHKASLNHGDENESVKLIEKRIGDPNFHKDYRDLRKRLHGDCFHQSKCDTKTVTLEMTMGEAQAMLKRILRSKSPKR